MSGFELQRQNAADKLAKVSEAAKSFSGEELNRDLLTSLQQSGDIVKDLWALYSDRPYVYARVMQQLGKVMGKAQLRKIHNDVIARAKAAAQDKMQQQLLQAQRPVLRSAKDGSLPVLKAGGKGDDADPEGDEKKDEGEKEFVVNVPKLGLNNVKVSVSSAENTQSVSSEQLPVPFLKNVKASVTFNSDKKVKTIEGSALFDAALFGGGSASLTLSRVGESSEYTPSVSFSNVTMNINGLDGLTASIGLGEGDAKVAGTISGSATILENVGVSANADVKTGGTDTSISGGLNVDSGGGEGKMSFSGSVELNAQNGTISGTKGKLSLTNINKLADPNGTVELAVDYDGENFKAELLDAVTLAPHTYGSGDGEGGEGGEGAKSDGGKATTVTVTVESASYDGAFNATFGVDADLAGIAHAEGSVTIEQNAITSGTLSVNAQSIPIIGENAFVTASFEGNVDVSDSGFSGTASGRADFKVGSDNISINLDELSFNSSGQFDGVVSLGEPKSFGPFKFESLTAEFSSSSGLKSADGVLSLETNKIKSDESGIAVSFAGDKLSANGTLKLLGAGEGDGEGGDAMATCDFQVDLMTDSYEGKGKFVLDRDYKVGSTKLCICSGAWAEIEVTSSDIAPITFEGSYNYGHADGAGGGGGGAAQASAVETGATESVAGGGSTPLMFAGDFKGCTYDVNTGALNGSATAQLESDFKIDSSSLDLTIKAGEQGDQTSASIVIADSMVTEISGDLSFDANVPVKSKNDTLSVHCDIVGYVVSVPSETFSGHVDATLQNDFNLVDNSGEGGNSLKLLSGDTGVQIDIAANSITSIGLKGAAQLDIQNQIFKTGKGSFKLFVEDATVNMDTLAISSPNIGVQAIDNVTFILGQDPETNTEISLIDGSGITANISENVVNSLSVETSFNGTTRALRTPDPLEFNGSSSFDIDDLQGSPTASGELTVTTTNACTLAKCEGVDELILMDGSSFKLVVDGNAPTNVEGNFVLDYTMKANDYLEHPLGATITGENLNYIVQEASFNGSVTVAPKEDIVFKPNGEAGAADASFTLKAQGTSITSEMTDNKITSLDGTAGFEAKASLKNTKDEASIEFNEGTAEFDINVDTGAISKLDVTSKVELNVQLSDKIEISSKDVTATASFDAEGLAQATFQGEIDLLLHLNNGTTAKFRIGSEGVNYTRETGISGDVTLHCDEEIKIGEISKEVNENSTPASYEYGLDSGQITASIESNTIKTLEGDAGLYLREQGSEDPLEVNGDISFNYDVEEDKLVKAEGEVTVHQKTLKHSEGGDLILKESKVNILVTNNSLNNVKGEVLLALSDAKNGEYLNFKSDGEFDCLNTNSVSGSVKAWFVNEKLIKEFDEIDFFVTPSGNGGDSAFDCEIKDNVITEFSGGINVMFRKKDGKDFFSGSVSGTYKSEEGTLNAEGTIALCEDMPFPDENGQFILGKGSEGTAIITDGDIESITGSLTVKIKSPKTDEGGGDSTIDITASGTVDVKNNLVEEFEGTAELNGEFPLGANLSLTDLGATVRIEQNVLQEISGSAGIKYETNGFTIEGGVDPFRWTKGESGENDTIYFKGDVSVTGFKDKLSGTAEIEYNSESNTVVCTGTLDFKVTDWLTGEVTVKFDNGNGWKNPEISGKIEATNVEMLPGTTLIGYASEDDSPEASIPIVGPLKAVLGVGFGASIDMKPLLVSGSATLKPCRLDTLSEGGLPEFEMDMEIASGLSLSATVAPYIGIEADFLLAKAGLRVKGKAEAVAEADASLEGKLVGGPQGLSGNVGIGFTVAATAALTIIPEVYAEGCGAGGVWPLKEWTFDLGNIFSFEWGKNYAFGDAPAGDGGDCKKTDLGDGGTKTEAVEAKAGEVEQKYGSKKSAPAVGDGKESPKLDSPDTVGQESFGKNVDGGASGMGGMMETISQVTAVAEGLGAIGEAIGFVNGLVGSFTVAGPLGVGIFVAAKILAGDLTLDSIKENITKIKKGAAALKQLIVGNADFLMSLLPEPIAKIVEFFQDVGQDGLVAKVVDALENAINGLGAPMNRILAPVIEFARGRQQKLGEIAKLFAQPVSGEGIVKIIFGILGFAVDSIDALVDTCRQVWDIFCGIFKECIASGDIFVRYKECWGPDEYFWQVKIPGLCNFKGEGKVGARIASEFLVGFAGVPREKIG